MRNGRGGALEALVRESSVRVTAKATKASMGQRLSLGPAPQGLALTGAL